MSLKPKLLQQKPMMCTILILFIVLNFAVQPVVAFAPANGVAPPSSSGVRATLTKTASSSSDTMDLDKSLREELKIKLLASADEFKSIQQDLNNAIQSEAKVEEDADDDTGRFFYFKLIRRMIGKILGKMKKKPKGALKIYSLMLYTS